MTFPFAPPSSDAAYDALTDSLAESNSILRPSSFPNSRAFVAFASPTVADTRPAARSTSPLLPVELHESGDNANPPEALSPARGPEGIRGA